MYLVASVCPICLSIHLYVHPSVDSRPRRTITDIVDITDIMDITDVVDITYITDIVGVRDDLVR